MEMQRPLKAERPVDTILVPLANDYIYSWLDPENILEKRITAARIDAIWRAHRFNRSYCAVVLTAGYCAASPTQPARWYKVPLAYQMKKYIWDYYPNWISQYRIIAAPTCWGTFYEMREAVKLAINSRLVTAEQKVRIVFCSDAIHLKRVRLYVEMYDIIPENWVVEYVTANYPVSRRYRAREFAARTVIKTIGQTSLQKE